MEKYLYELKHKQNVCGVEFGVYEKFPDLSPAGMAEMVDIIDPNIPLGLVIAPTKIFATHNEAHDGDRGLTQPREKGGAIAVATAADEGGELGIDELKLAREFVEELRIKLGVACASKSGAFRWILEDDLQQLNNELISSTSDQKPVLQLSHPRKKDSFYTPIISGEFGRAAELFNKRYTAVDKPSEDPKTRFFDEIMLTVNGAVSDEKVPKETKHSLVVDILKQLDLKEKVGSYALTATEIDDIIDKNAPNLTKFQRKFSNDPIQQKLRELCNKELNRRRDEKSQGQDGGMSRP